MRKKSEHSQRRVRQRPHRGRGETQPPAPGATEPAAVIDSKIVALLKKRRKHGVRLRDLPRAARLTPAEAAQLPERLSALLRSGTVAERQQGRQLVLGSALGLVAGRLQAHPDGYAFVITDDPRHADYYVPRNRVRPAMHGDRVLARVEPSRRGRQEARIVEVLQRDLTRLIGTYHPTSRGAGVVQPQEERITYLAHVPAGRSAGARDGDLVVARIVSYPTVYGDLESEVDVVLGAAADPGVETEAVIYRYGLPLTFPSEVLAAAHAVPQAVPAAALHGRLDLRDRLIVTIDGENARDFDDAVGIEVRRHGFRLLVSIADVAHYVADGGPVDQEAATRGTSVYFPDRVIPMLPEALSNGICSLNPAVDRLTKTVVLEFDQHGEVEHAQFHDSVIRSVARLTYTDVRRILIDHDAAARDRYGSLVAMLETMEQLCRILMQRRRARGSIDFDLPEAEVILDLTGRPEAIIRAERHIGHQIIEEFMLAANEAVARHLRHLRVPFPHRVHEPPDADTVSELSRFLATFGLRLPTVDGTASPRDFQRVLQAVTGRPEERLINTVLLRSMKQAHYTPEALGHFGLATDAYTHFTSPIRRYPDLVVHRILGEVLRTKHLAPERRADWSARLPAITEASSRRERIAMDAERDIVDLRKIQFMQDKVGTEYGGFISGVHPFGFFVELQDYFVEGLVHVQTLTDDYYEYVERAHLLRGRRTQRIFRLGDPLRVRVVGTDPVRRRIDFQVVAEPAPESEHTRRPPRRRRQA